MKIDMKKGTVECEIHNDFFALHKMYGMKEDNERYWGEVCDATNQFYKKYEGTVYRPMVLRMALGFLEYLDGNGWTMRSRAEVAFQGLTKEEKTEFLKEAEKIASSD